MEDCLKHIFDSKEESNQSLSSTLNPNLKDFSNLRRYIVDNKRVRNSLYHFKAVKINLPLNWEAKFNTNVYENIFHGENNHLSLCNVETIDSLSFKRFYVLYMKEKSMPDPWSLDYSEFGTSFDLYKLYKAHYGENWKWMSDKKEHIGRTCCSLGINVESVESLQEIIDKYLDGFHSFLVSDNKDLDLNLPQSLSRHLHLIRSLHVSTSSPPRGPIQPLALKPSDRAQKLKLIGFRYRKCAITPKYKQRNGGSSSWTSVDQYCKKMSGLKKSGSGRIQKSKSSSYSISGEILGVRATRSMVRRSSGNDMAATGSNGAGSNGSKNGSNGVNGDQTVTEDNARRSKSESPETVTSESQSCQQCGVTDIPRSQLRHCFSCDLYSHAFCSSLPSSSESKLASSPDLSSKQWQCPICFTFNCVRGFASAATIPTSGSGASIYQTLVQHATTLKRQYNISTQDDGSSEGEGKLLEHFWQIVTHGGTKHADQMVYHAKLSANQMSGFKQGSPEVAQFVCNPLVQGDYKSLLNTSSLEFNTVTIDGAYSTQGFRQENYLAPSLHYIHKGAKKTWYIVKNVAQLGPLLQTVAPVLFPNARHNLDLLAYLPLLIHPEDLLSNGVEFEVVDQTEGEMVLFYPGVVKCYVSHGASISETTVLPLPQWAPVLSRYFTRTRNPRLELPYGYLLTTLVSSILFTLPVKIARRLFTLFKKYVDRQTANRKQWQQWTTNIQTVDSLSAKFQDGGRCSVCHQRVFLVLVQFKDTLYCMEHAQKLADEERKQATLYLDKMSSDVDTHVNSLVRRFNMYDQFARSVSMLQDIRKKPDASDLKDLLQTGRDYELRDNIYFEHLETNEKCLVELETKFLKADVNQLTIPQLVDLRLVAEASDFSLPGEARLVSLLASDDEPRRLLGLYQRGRISVTRLRKEMERLPGPNPVNRTTLETISSTIKVGLVVEEITQSIQRIHRCSEDRIETLIEASYRLPPSPELENCVSILKQVLEERLEWKNRALDLLDKDEPKVPLDDWIQVVNEGKHIDDYQDIKDKLTEQIELANEFEKEAKAIVIYDLMNEQPLTHDVDEIAKLLQEADANIQISLDTYELLSKEHKDAGIWLRLADLCFLWPKSELEIISILMPKSFCSSSYPWFSPLVPGRTIKHTPLPPPPPPPPIDPEMMDLGMLPEPTPPAPPQPKHINEILGEILGQDKRDIIRQEYQALLSLRSYHQNIKQTEFPQGPNSKVPMPVCFCGRNIYCSLIFCYLCRSYYHEKCIMKALKRREVHNTESNISNLNYKVPPNLSALGDLDLFICVKCVWGKRPRLPDVKGRIVDVLSEVRLKLPEGIALIHCLQRTMFVQQEIIMYLNCREVIKLKELSEHQRQTEKLMQEEAAYSSSSSRTEEQYPNNEPGSLNSSQENGSGGSGNGGGSGSSRTAGDLLITKQRKHKRKSTLIPRIDNDALSASINTEDIKAAGIELLNKGLLNEIHIPELSTLLTFLRRLDKEFGYYPKVKLSPPVKRPQIKKPLPPLSVGLEPMPSGIQQPPYKKLAKMKNTSYQKVKFSKVKFSASPQQQEGAQQSHDSPTILGPQHGPPLSNTPSDTDLYYSSSSPYPSPSSPYSSSASLYPPSSSSPSIYPSCSGLNVVAEAALLASQLPLYPQDPNTGAARASPQKQTPVKTPNVKPTKTPKMMKMIKMSAASGGQNLSTPGTKGAGKKSQKQPKQFNSPSMQKVLAKKSPGTPATPGAPGAAAPAAGPKPPKTPTHPASSVPGSLATPGSGPPKQQRQRKPRTSPSTATPGGSKTGAQTKDSTPLPPTKKKKKSDKKFELCDLEDCLEPDGEIDWVQCDKCERWFHFICVGISSISKDDPYVCTYCCNNMCKMDSTEANEDLAVTSLLSLSRGFI
uniref:Lysine-specific demethylase 5B n=1 Tax=Cacopsylla melanoneura TaxID=428564 RepID=A0A8D8QJA3_9HEMI